MISSISIVILVLLLGHFAADFIFQSNWMAQNKSSSIVALSAHVLAYTVVLFLFSLLTTEFWLDAVVFAVVNGLIHFLVDFNTSKLTSYLWEKKEVHWFFVAIGFDQFIHQATIIITADLFLLQKIIQF